MSIHILRTPGYYIAQVRGVGCRNWRTINQRKYKTAENALAAAVQAMSYHDKRARALFCPTGETGAHYDPHVAMEAKRV